MFALQINSRASVTQHITFLVHTVVIHLLVLGIERRNRIDSTAFFGFVRRLTYFYSHIFRSCVFYCYAISVPLTLNIALYEPLEIR